MSLNEDQAPVSTRKPMKPFGQNKAEALLIKQQALATLSRQECFDRGFLTVQDLDDEELRYGRCRDITGHIPSQKGRTTELIPKERYDEFVAEHNKRMQQQLRQRADEMIRVIVDIALDETVEPRDRFESAKYALERVVGKTPDVVNVNVKTAPWEELLGSVTGIANITRRESRELGTGIVEAEWDEIDEGVSDDDTEQSDRQDTTDVHSADYDEPESTIRPQTPTDDADVERHKVDDVDAHPAPEAAGPQTSSPGIEGKAATPEPYTTVDSQTVAGGLEEDRFRPQGTVVANNTRDSDAMYMNEGDLPTYGHRKAERKSYAEQARDAADLAVRRADARANRAAAKKRRKIARAMGADAIKDEITGATVGEDGKVHFE